MWKASSFRSSPSWTNESVTRCSSSGPSKNPHTWRWPPSVAPARWIACEPVMGTPNLPGQVRGRRRCRLSKSGSAFQERVAGRASATMLPPVGGGGGAIQSLKCSRQVRLAAETGRKRDLHDRLLRAAQQGRGPLEPSLQQILMHRTSHGPFEPPREMCSAHACPGGQGQQQEILAQVCLDVLDDSPEATRGKIFGGLRCGGEDRMVSHQLR